MSKKQLLKQAGPAVSRDFLRADKTKKAAHVFNVLRRVVGRTQIATRVVRFGDACPYPVGSMPEKAMEAIQTNAAGVFGVRFIEVHATAAKVAIDQRGNHDTEAGHRNDRALDGGFTSHEAALSKKRTLPSHRMVSVQNVVPLLGVVSKESGVPVHVTGATTTIATSTTNATNATNATNVNNATKRNQRNQNHQNHKNYKNYKQKTKTQKNRKN
jgi:hypothetical protein